MALTRLNSLRDVLRIWFYWKKTAVLTFVVLFLSVVVYSYLATPVFQSTAKILLLPKSAGGSVIAPGTNDSRVTVVTTKDVNTEMELIYSNDVIAETVRSFSTTGLGLSGQGKGISLSKIFAKLVDSISRLLGLTPALSDFDRKVLELKNALEITYNDDSNILFVSLKAEDPQAAATVLNRLLNIYIKHHDQVYTKVEGLSFYRDQAEHFRTKLKQAEKALEQFKRENGIVDLQAQNEANITLLADLRQTLKELEIVYDEALARLTLLKKALKQNHERILITKEMRTIPAIVKLEENIVPLLIKRSEIQKCFTPQSREYRDMNEQIATLHNEILKEVQRAIKTDELELNTLRAKRDSLRAKVSALQLEALNLDQKQKRLAELKRSIEIYKKNYMLYSFKTEDSRIENERVKRNLANVSIADQARPSFIPVFPKRLLMFFLGLVFSAFAALLIPFILEAMDRKLKSVSDTEEFLSLPVVASFPLIRQ